MNWLNPPLPIPQARLLFAASLIVGASAAAVIVAMLANFALARRSGDVESRAGSAVTTATMLAFFFAFHQVIHRKIGVVRIDDMRILVALTVPGLALVVGGAVINIVGRLQLGANWADHITVYKQQTLVTHGVYGFVRHPLYASLIWMFAGASMIYHSWLGALGLAGVFAPAVAMRAAQEEVLLRERFPEYSDYASRVGRLVPRPGRRSDVHV